MTACLLPGATVSYTHLDYAVVAEVARMAGKDRESIVEADKRLSLATAATAGKRCVGAEETGNQVTDQTGTLVTPG